jgi:hypothetical protein
MTFGTILKVKLFQGILQEFRTVSDFPFPIDHKYSGRNNTYSKRDKLV